jgi:predicted PurR-regulated permease PerM
MRTNRIDISHKTIFFITGFLALLWTLFLIRDLILLLFVCVIFVSALAPLVDRLVKMKFPKPLAIAVVYILIIAILAAIITLGLTPITTQTSSLVDKLTMAINSLSKGPLSQFSIKDQLPNISSNLLTYTLDIFRSFITAVLVAVITFYILLDKERLEARLARLFQDRENVRGLIKKIEIKLGGWMRGQLMLSLFVAVIIYVGLSVLGIPYALPLAIISGLFEVVPIIGPILSAIPGILIALTVSPVLALIVAGLYLIVQQLESHVLVPQVMKRAVGLNPLVVILAIAIGDRLLGVTGALLAVPIAVMVQILMDEYLNGEKEEAPAK